MKKNYLFTTLLVLMSILFSNKAMAQVDWLGTYTVTAKCEDNVAGTSTDKTFTMIIGKDGNDYVVTQLDDYTDIMYGGLLCAVDRSDERKLHVYCDNISMTSSDAEREQGIYKYVSLRDANGGKDDIVLEQTSEGVFKMDDFTTAQTQRGSSEQKTLRTYTVSSVTNGNGGGGEVAATNWEKIYALPSCYAFHIDKKTGNFMASDFRDDLQGGIYYSEDKGATWTKTKVQDHNFGKFYETDAYTFALGYGGRIARSDDGGKTWELMSYRRAIQDIVSAEDMDYTAAYDMLQMGNRIYLCDYAGGVIYSEDYGESWKHTADDIFLETVEGKQGTETIHNVLYGMAEQNGHIFAMGLYCVYEYDAAKDTWKIVRTDSNLMAIHCTHKGTLYCGRAMPNDGYRNPFLELTEDGENWTICPHPDSEDNNVRALGSNNALLVVGLQSTGMLYTDDDCETWYDLETSGLPLRYPGKTNLADQKLTPLSIEFDQDYVYVAFFGDDPKTEPGIWRYPLKDIMANVKPLTEEQLKAYGIYDLQGRRLSEAPQKGLYIKDGKKILR